MLMFPALSCMLSTPLRGIHLVLAAFASVFCFLDDFRFILALQLLSALGQIH